MICALDAFVPRGASAGPPADRRYHVSGRQLRRTLPGTGPGREQYRDQTCVGATVTVISGPLFDNATFAFRVDPEHIKLTICHGHGAARARPGPDRAVGLRVGGRSDLDHEFNVWHHRICANLKNRSKIMIALHWRRH
jgi:hypothetical protein